MLNPTTDKSLVYNWFRHCEEANLILCFQGDFNQDLVNAILTLAETKNEYNNNQTQIKSRVFSVMLECMQNICKYAASSEKKGELKPGIVLVGKGDNLFFIQTGNLVKNTDVENLEKRLAQVTKMNKDELKSLHKKMLRETTLNEKSGAGLGFLGIARKAEKISYQFNKINEAISFFAIEVIITVNAD